MKRYKIYVHYEEGLYPNGLALEAVGDKGPYIPYREGADEWVKWEDVKQLYDKLVNEFTKATGNYPYTELEGE